ncbi:hypothetical protein NL676_013830 [Syzygium grande]|nr:hypothetical protein NL676_013830 [Syzygium grande]
MKSKVPRIRGEKNLFCSLIGFLLLVETADRAGLLVDLVKIITEINIAVESGEFDTEGLLAKAKFHVSYKGKAIIKPLQQVLANSLRGETGEVDPTGPLARLDLTDRPGRGARRGRAFAQHLVRLDLTHRRPQTRPTLPDRVRDGRAVSPSSARLASPPQWRG